MDWGGKIRRMCHWAEFVPKNLPREGSQASMLGKLRFPETMQSAAQSSGPSNKKDSGQARQQHARHRSPPWSSGWQVGSSPQPDGHSVMQGPPITAARKQRVKGRTQEILLPGHAPGTTFLTGSHLLTPPSATAPMSPFSGPASECTQLLGDIQI